MPGPEPNRPLRVLVLADSPYFGGITSHILAIEAAFRAGSDVAVHLACLPGKHNDATLADVCQTRGIPLHAIPMRPGALRRVLGETGAGLLHVHQYRATLLAAVARPGVPVVSTFHGMAVGDTWRVRAWQALALRAMRRHARVVAVSEHARRVLLRRGIPEPRLTVVHNGCTEPARSPQPPDLPKTAEAAFVYAGRLVAGKGLPVLLEAMAGVSGARLVIAGDGPLRPELEALAANTGAPVTFTGRVADPAPYYRAANAVVLPSDMEALPLNLIEAAACGVPAIATRVGGIPEIVEDGVTGLLVVPGDAGALRAALERLRDRETAGRMGEAARVRWETRFTRVHMADGLRRVYREAAGL